MKKGIGPRGLGVSKSPAKMYGAKSPAKKTTNLPEVTVVGKKGKGLKETTEVGKGYSASDYSAERKRLTKEAQNAFNTKNKRAPGSKIGSADMSAIRDGVRTTLSKTGYTEGGVRRKSDNTRLTSEQESQYKRRVNPSNL